jgi:hypothetical protein
VSSTVGAIIAARILGKLDSNSSSVRLGEEVFVVTVVDVFELGVELDMGMGLGMGGGLEIGIGLVLTTGECSHVGLSMFEPS